jgi:hypothetical protein
MAWETAVATLLGNAIIICFLRVKKSFNKKNKERFSEYYMYELWARTRTTSVV